MKILAISGSLRADSYNTALARAAVERAPEGTQIELYDRLGEIPPSTPIAMARPTPEAVRDLRERIARSDALLFVTPEYNGSISGVLKNAIDWASRPPRGDAALWGKTVAVAGATTGQYGAIWAQQDLRRILGIAGRGWSRASFRSPRAQNVFDAEGACATRCSPIDSGSTSRTSSHEAAASPPRRLTRERRGAAARRPLDPDTSVGLVEALPALLSNERTCGAKREPPTLARRFPVVPGARLYPLVPPLPVLSSLKPDHLLSAVRQHTRAYADFGTR